MTIVTPRLIGFDAAMALTEDTVDSNPRRLNADIAFADTDFAGGTQTVRGLLPEDRVTLTADCMIGI